MRIESSILVDVEARLHRGHVGDRCARGGSQWGEVGGESRRNQLHGGLALKRGVLLPWSSDES